jgi:hypothetical protein
MTLAGDILAGKHDAELSLILEAIRDRRKTLAQVKSYDIKIGDKVVFNGSARPAYLVGAKAVVTGRLRNKLQIKLLEDAGRFISGYPVGCPPGIVDKIDDTTQV